jgi:tartronate-semialdehyde synthase
MARMDVMDAVVKVIEDEGVEVAFGVPGAAILPLYKAMSRSAKIRHYSVRHEEGGTHAADGYPRVTGKVGITDRNLRSRGDEYDHRPVHLHG